MGVEVEMGIGITLDHLTEVLDTLEGVHDAEGVGEHETADADVAEFVHHLIDIGRRLLHTVGPVLEIEVDGHALAAGIVDGLTDIVDMFLGGLVKLFLTMAERAFGKEVDGLGPTGMDPVDALAAVDESKHLYTFEAVDPGGIAADHADSFLLTLGHSRRGHLDTVDVEVVEEHAGDHQFLMWQEADAIGLLPVAQGRVHNLDKRLQAVVLSYLFCCSHKRVFS